MCWYIFWIDTVMTIMKVDQLCFQTKKVITNHRHQISKFVFTSKRSCCLSSSLPKMWWPFVTVTPGNLCSEFLDMLHTKTWKTCCRWKQNVSYHITLTRMYFPAPCNKWWSVKHTNSFAVWLFFHSLCDKLNSHITAL